MSAHVYSSPTGFGVDVASARRDDLDKKCLAVVAALPSATLLDLGCGLGGFAQAAAEAGAKVTAIDQHDFSKEFADTDVRFIQARLQDLEAVLVDEKFSVVYCQRTIHYLPYAEALEVLRFLHTISDQLCISATGLGSEAGRRYAPANLPIEGRFAPLAPDIAEKLMINEPVCLYSEEEFAGLLRQAGWQIEKLWSSAFGNIKAICKTNS